MLISVIVSSGEAPAGAAGVAAFGGVCAAGVGRRAASGVERVWG